MEGSGSVQINYGSGAGSRRPKKGSYGSGSGTLLHRMVKQSTLEKE